MENNYYDGGFVLDLMEILRFLRKKLWIIVLAGIICFAGALIGSKLMLKPQYTASTRAYVLNQADHSSVAMSDFQVSSQMLSDYRVLITGRNVTQEVIDTLGLKQSANALASKITVTSPGNTRVLEIKVTDEDPEQAARIANCVQEIAIRQLTEIMGLDSVKLIYQAEVPGAPSSPNIKKNAMIGFVLGLVLSTAGCIGYYLLDDTIRTEDDVTRYLELSTLGSIPISDQLRRDPRMGKKKVHGFNTPIAGRKGH